MMFEKEHEGKKARFILGEQPTSIRRRFGTEYKDDVLWFVNQNDVKSAKLESKGSETLEQLRTNYRSAVNSLKKDKAIPETIAIRSRTENKKVTGVWIVKE